MGNSGLTKSLILKYAQHSLGQALQKARRKRGLDLRSVTENTHISAHEIDLLEIGKSRRFNHAVKLALYYGYEIKIDLIKFHIDHKK